MKKGRKEEQPEGKKNVKVVYNTKLGKYYHGKVEDVLGSKKFSTTYKGKINLIFTSPPFPLNKKKKYGNKQGDEYLEWLSDLAILFNVFLAPKGSIVIEIGNAWTSGSPTMSTLPMKALLKFLEKGKLELCQQFIWYNTAKLPTPAEWVNIRRIRVKDAFTNIWWMSKTAYPKASNRRVLKAYSDSMKSLLKRQKYNSGNRPSQHNINKTSFLKENKGAIPPNVISSPNTFIDKNYQEYCEKNNLPLHPARMPLSLAEFFINFLTTKNDLILDPFGGSNTTGKAAEELGRKWISIETKKEYILGSKGRFRIKQF
mgnify:CR=1 FL=1